MNLHKFMHKNTAHRPTLCATTTYLPDYPDAIISTQAPLKTSLTPMSKVPVGQLILVCSSMFPNYCVTERDTLSMPH